MTEKEKLKEAKRLYQTANADQRYVLESLFPELKESEDDEDEKIRKALFNFFDEADKVDVNPMYEYDIPTDKIISWLEKQRTSNEAIEYLKKNHSPSEISDFQEAMNIAVAKAYDKGKRDTEKQGEKKQSTIIWHDAQGDDLPEIDREVIVLTQSYPLEKSEYAIHFAHRPYKKGYLGKSLVTGNIETYYPDTYGKGGWSIPDVKYWLDIEFPNE